MVRRRILWPAIVGLALTCSACSPSNSAETTEPGETRTSTEAPATTTEPESPTDTTADPETDTTAGPTTTEAAPEESLLDGSGERPPGAEDQLNYSVLYSLSCSGTVNGPGQSDREFEISDVGLTRLSLGELVWRDLIIAVEADPDLGSHFETLIPDIIIAPRPPTIAPPTTLPGFRLEPLPSIELFEGAFELTVPTITLPPEVILPPVTVPPPERVLIVEQTQTAYFCGTGWTTDEMLTITITDPDGELAYDDTVMASGFGFVSFFWAPSLGNPVGQYTVRVTNGQTTVTDTFEVISPVRATVGFLTRSVEPGGTVVIGLEAFPSDESLNLHVFRNASDFSGLEWVGTIHDVAIDANGRSRVDLVTLETDPPGTYCLLPEIEDAKPCTEASFEVLEN